MPTLRAPSRFLTPAVAVAREAGREIMAIYHTNFRVGRK
jgi:hypothetical protein